MPKILKLNITTRDFIKANEVTVQHLDKNDNVLCIHTIDEVTEPDVGVNFLCNKAKCIKSGTYSYSKYFLDGIEVMSNCVAFDKTKFVKGNPVVFRFSLKMANE